MHGSAVPITNVVISVFVDDWSKSVCSSFFKEPLVNREALILQNTVAINLIVKPFSFVEDAFLYLNFISFDPFILYILLTEQAFIQ